MTLGFIYSFEVYVCIFRYGPCQTPTLGFCVERHLQITTFSPESFWSVRPWLNKGGHQLQLSWERNRIFDKDVSVYLQGESG